MDEVGEGVNEVGEIREAGQRRLTLHAKELRSPYHHGSSSGYESQ